MTETIHTQGSSGVGSGQGVADQARDKAGEAKSQVQDQAQQVAAQAQEKAQQATGQAKSTVKSQIDTRSTQAGQQVKSQASDLRTVGEELRKQGKDTPAKLADQVAERTERIGDYLHNSNADRILHDVENMARRQPTVVALGGLALGFLASRFLKASSTQRYEQTYSSGQRQLNPGYGASTGYATSTTSTSRYGTGAGTSRYETAGAGYAGTAGADYASTAGAPRSPYDGRTDDLTSTPSGAPEQPPSTGSL